MSAANEKFTNLREVNKMAIGYYATLAQAELYFEAERLITVAWDALDALASGDTIKTKALMNAYNRLYYDPRFSLPTLAAATATELVILKKAQAEMAYYLAEHLEDEDSRKGLQAQAVVEAGIMKEKYKPEDLEKIPVPPFVLGLLNPWATNKQIIVAAELDRDEELDADEDPQVD